MPRDDLPGAYEIGRSEDRSASGPGPSSSSTAASAPPGPHHYRAVGFRAVGFRPVGIMRAYERGDDGTWHDSLLLDLLAGELDPGG